MEAIPWIVIAFLAATALQLVIYWGIYARFAFGRHTPESEERPPVSVIVAARNEHDNLLAYLPLIFQQHYPEFEVVVVDDRSYDGTGEVLKAFSLKYPNCKVVTVREPEDRPGRTTHFHGGKKYALTLGIKAATHEHLLFTDADCQPTSDQWITAMASRFSDRQEIVLGYGPYGRQPGWLNRLIRWDTLMVGLQYFSLARVGLPYMGVGRNLAYRKSLFFGNKGFASHQHIASGDDDLFIGEVIKRHNFAVCLAPDRTVSNPETTWRGWLRQKGRHLTTSVHYKGSVKVPLGLISMSQMLFFGLFTAVLILHPLHWWMWGAFALRVLSQMVIFSFVTKKLGERDLLWLAPLLEAILLLIYPIFALSNLIAKRNTWRT